MLNRLLASPKSPLSNAAPQKRLAPAILAVLIQFAALICVLLCVFLVNFVLPQYTAAVSLHFAIVALVFLQALLATMFSIVFRMAGWWSWIHFFFPVALWAMSLWHLPSNVYLIGFLISLGLFWTTYRTQVPFFPSRPVVWQEVAKLIPQDKPLRMVDIGSGLGDLVMHIAKLRVDSHIGGIEIAPLPWLISVVRSALKRSPAVFKLGDYRKLDFAYYDVVFAYLSPVAMLALWEKAQREMQPGSLLISLEFEIPGARPSFCIETAKQSPMIFVWKM